MREQQFRDIVSGVADGILVIGDDDAVLFVNPASEVLLGRTAAELIGTRLGQPIVADTSTEMGILGTSGEVVTVEMRAVDIVWDGAPAVLASLRDVSERIQTRTRIEHLNSVLRAIRNVNQVIVQEMDPEKLIRQCCEVLTENREYDAAWIAVDSGAGTTSLFAHSGGGGELDRFTDSLRDGEWPRCREVVLAAEDCLVVAAPAPYCDGCPLSITFDSSNDCVVTTLHHGDDVLGILGVSLAPAISNDEEERDLLKEVARDVAFALHDIEIERHQRETDRQLAQGAHDLGERVKELHCLHAASVLVLDAHRTVEDVLQGIVDLLPSTMQHSEHACARLVLEGQEYQANGFVETPWLLSAEIQVYNEPAGCIEVGYLGQLPASGEEPFLPEEEQLLMNVARKVVQFIERKRAEEALRTSESEFHTLAESMPQIVWITRPDGWNIFFNQQWMDYTGLSLEESLGHGWNKPFHPDDQQRAWDAWEKATSENCTYSIESRLRRADGAYRWWLVRGVPMLDDAGNIIKWYGTCTDIHDLKAQEQHVREETERAQRYLDIAAVMLLGLDTDGRITLINRCGLEILGVEHHRDLVGEDWLQFIPADGREKVKEFHRAIIRDGVGENRRVEAPFLTATGEQRSMVLHNAAVRDAQGTIVGTLSSGEDVTERREMEGQLAQSDRLASMGMLAAGVAHEINNPLSYTLYNLESLTEDLPNLISAARQVKTCIVDSPETSTTDGGLEEASRLMNQVALDDMLSRFNDALDGTRRIRDVVGGLGTFAKVEKDELVPVNLSHVIDGAINMALNQIKYRARVVKDYGTVPTVLASEGRLSQVFLNLIINSTHALDEGNLENNEIRVRTWLDGDEACAEVRDTGSGIRPENMKRLFDPFFTTKEIDVGSGLGLAISKNIIEGYHGTISVQSEVGKGTSFTIRLPVRTEAVEPIPAAAEPSEEPEVHGRILIVDDEAAVRSIMVRMLREHESVQAGNGAEAKKILENDQAFDVILCDVMMPEISGVDLHRWLVDAHPALAARLVFVTGGAFTSRTREYLAAVSNVQLEKPLKMARLKKVVGELVVANQAKASRRVPRVRQAKPGEGRRDDVSQS